MLRSRNALSPVIGTIILVAVVIAVTVATVGWIGGLTTNLMQTEELIITGEQWGLDCTYVNLILRNKGTAPITISDVSVNSHKAAFTVASGSKTISPGSPAAVRVKDNFIAGTKYSIQFTTKQDNFFLSSVEAKLIPSKFRMEWGTTTVNSTFKTVQLQNQYESPIVVCSPNYSSGLPRTVRLKDVSSNSFVIKVQNPSDTPVPDTSVSYLVVEEGVWTSPFKMEAAKYSTNTVGENNNWRYDTRNYGQTYSGKIVVLHQVMSTNDITWITSYVSRANSRTDPPRSSDSGFRIALNGAEAVNSHGSEEIGYIVLQESTGVLDEIKWESKQTSDSISGFSNSPPYYTSFSQTFADSPSVTMACLQEVDGSDGGWVAVCSVTSNQLGLVIDEDQAKDSERSHTSETCGFIVFEFSGSYLE